MTHKAWNLSSGKQNKFRKTIRESLVGSNKGKLGFLSTCEGSTKEIMKVVIWVMWVLGTQKVSFLEWEGDTEYIVYMLQLGASMCGSCVFF